MSTELDLRQHRAIVEVMDPPELMTPEVAEAFRRHAPEHPLIAHYARTGDGRARKVSDFLTTRQLHRLPIDNEYVRPFFGLEHQLAIATTATPGRGDGRAVTAPLGGGQDANGTTGSCTTTARACPAAAGAHTPSTRTPGKRWRRRSRSPMSSE